MPRKSIADRLAKEYELPPLNHQVTKKQGQWNVRDFYTSMYEKDDTPTKEITTQKNGYDVSVIVYLDEGTKPKDLQCFVTVNSPKSDGPVLLKASEVDDYIKRTT